MTIRSARGAGGLVLALATALSAFGQIATSRAELNGALRDASGGMVKAGIIAIRNLDTNQMYTTRPGATGLYIAPNLSPGTYEMTVLAPGFAKYTHSGIALSVGQTATLDANPQ